MLLPWKSFEESRVCLAVQYKSIGLVHSVGSQSNDRQLGILWILTNTEDKFKAAHLRGERINEGSRDRTPRKHLERLFAAWSKERQKTRRAKCFIQNLPHLGFIIYD